MWKITYSVNNHCRNRDNYPEIISGDPDFVVGDTLEEAITNLHFYLEQGRLKSIIETHAANLTSFDDCYDLEVISIDEIIQLSDIDVLKHPLFANLIEIRKFEISTVKKKKEQKEKYEERRSELAQLKKLKEKYEEKE